MPRGNNNNLIPGNERSHSEATENGRKGGINSGKSRQKRKAIKARLSTLLGMKPNFEDMPDELRAAIVMAGISLDDIETNDDLLLIAAFVRGLSDTTAMKYIDELMGRNPQLELRKKELQLRRIELNAKIEQDKAKLEIAKQRLSGKIELETLIDDDLDVEP